MVRKIENEKMLKWVWFIIIIVLSALIIYKITNEYLMGKNYIGLIVFIPAIIGFSIGWILYFVSIKYLKRKTKWTDYTGYGPLIYTKGYDIIKPEGRNYAKGCMYFLSSSVIYVFASLILFKILGLL